jgi:protein tyrosine phosphatase (PTP) superfamily phosphohydrolase (DUF442 family)
MTDPSAIDRWHRLNPRLTSSGQPSEAELSLIAALGVRHIINLGLPSHPRALPNEAISVAALGLDYTAIPVEFSQPTEADFMRFCALMTQCNGVTIHIHCIANYRVSAFIYRYRRQILQWPDSAARPDLLHIWQPNPVWAAFIALDP